MSRPDLAHNSPRRRSRFNFFGGNTMKLSHIGNVFFRQGRESAPSHGSPEIPGVLSHQRLTQGSHETPAPSGLMASSVGFLHSILFSFALNGHLWWATLDIFFTLVRTEFSTHGWVLLSPLLMPSYRIKGVLVWFGFLSRLHTQCGA